MGPIGDTLLPFTLYTSPLTLHTFRSHGPDTIHRRAAESQTGPGLLPARARPVPARGVSQGRFCGPPSGGSRVVPGGNRIRVETPPARARRRLSDAHAGRAHVPDFLRS